MQHETSSTWVCGFRGSNQGHYARVHTRAREDEGQQTHNTHKPTACPSLPALWLTDQEGRDMTTDHYGSCGHAWCRAHRPPDLDVASAERRVDLARTRLQAARRAYVRGTGGSADVAGAECELHLALEDLRAALIAP